MITLIKAREISLSKIATLNSEFCKQAYEWYETVLKEGILPYVYEGFRSFERQQQLYDQGRTKPGKIVTKALPGQSYHNYGLAFDWVSLRPAEKAEGMYEPDWDNEVDYITGNRIGEKLGMTQLSWERPHLQTSKYSTWRDIPGSNA